MSECRQLQQKLLEIPFTTVQEYLEGLEFLCRNLSQHQGKSLIYLAAAVSDFYIPNPAEHKIQSREFDKLTIELEPVPKLLGQIKLWSPSTVAISFKLETDPSLLFKKALSSIESYKVDMVVANLLQSVRTDCSLITASDRVDLKASPDTELEYLIVSAITKQFL